MDTITAQLLQTGIKISELPAATQANATDEFEVNQGGTTRKVTLQQMGLDITGGMLSAEMKAWLVDPTSAKLALAVTDETGSGALVFAHAPQMDDVVITDPEFHGGTADQMVITNATLDGGFMGSMIGNWAGTPNFTASPTVPTIVTGSNTDQRIANVATIINQMNLILPGYATLNSPIFTGDPRAPTPATSDNDTSIATTAYVKANIAAIDLSIYAPLASPTFTGDPKAPTPATADNDTSIATTAFVKAQGYAPLANPLFTGAVGVNGAPGSAKFRSTGANGDLLALFSGPARGLRVVASATETSIEGVDQTGVGSFQPLRLFGTTVAIGGTTVQLAGTTNTAPTPTAGDSSTKVATTAFVAAAIASGASITVGTTPPVSPNPNQLWWNSETGTLFLYYNDGSTSQWVPATAPSAAQSGALCLYSESVLTVAGPNLDVTFPTTARMVKLIFEAQAASGADTPCHMRAMQAGVVNTGANYSLTRHMGTSPSTSSTDVVLSAAQWGMMGGFIYRGEITFTAPAKGMGVGQFADVVAAGGLRRIMNGQFEGGAMTGIDGCRLFLGSGNFAVGSLMRAFVVT